MKPRLQEPFEKGVVLGPESSQGDTVAHLLRLAASRREDVPRLLVLTVLIQVLKYLLDLHERGQVDGALTPSRLLLSERSAKTLWSDPSRDPRLRVSDEDGDVHEDAAAYQAPEIRAGGPATPASDLWSAGAISRALLNARPGLRLRRTPRSLRSLVAGLLQRHPETRWPLTQALEEARRQAMVLFEEWDRGRRARLAENSRREAELRHQLSKAIYHVEVEEAAWREQQLRYFLGRRASSDSDLEIAQSWLEEQAELEESRHQQPEHPWLKLALTALPVAFAIALTALLAFVLIWG